MINYVIMSILAILMGQVVSHLNKKMPAVVLEEISYKEYYKTLFQDFKIDYKYSIILLILGNLLIYFNNLVVFAYLNFFVITSLLIVFSIDYRFQLIPDECDIFILLIAIIKIIINSNNIGNYILGSILGGGFFFLISLMSLLILKKEGMGFGDVKLMGVLGLFLGAKNIITVTLISFFIGAIVGTIFLIVKRKTKENYMAFGPFIVLGTLLIMYINPDVFINLYLDLCINLSNLITNFIN